MKVRKILVSQAKPETQKSPYFDLATRHNLQIEFRPFVQIDEISVKDFRQQKVEILDYTAIVFSSRTAIDHFFRICEELKIVMPEKTKYFCNSETAAFYLHKYIVYRKRKVFYSNGKQTVLIDAIKKNKGEKFLVALSDNHKQEITDLMTKAKIKYAKASFYRTVSGDLSDMNISKYDIIVFFSPLSITSLFHNFPDFKQNKIAIAAFGSATAKAVIDAGLRLDIEAPLPNAPSMTAALENFINDNL